MKKLAFVPVALNTSTVHIKKKRKKTKQNENIKHSFKKDVTVKMDNYQDNDTNQKVSRS